MSPQDLLRVIAGHDWMPVVLMFSVVVRTWLTDKSKFPLSLPPNWQPVVVAGATAFLNVVASLQAHESWQVIVGSTLAWAASTGFLDGVLAAIWGDPKKAPAWGRFIVMAFDDLESHGGGGGGTGAVTIHMPDGTAVQVPSGAAIQVPDGAKVVTVGGGGGGGSGDNASGNAVQGAAIAPPAPASSPTLVVKVPSLPPKPIVNERIMGPLGYAGMIAFGLVTIGQSALLFSACGAAMPGVPSRADVAQYFADQNGCVDHSPSRAAIDVCRQTNKAQWCAKFPNAGDCLPDDGGLADGGGE